jgi:hypothetical protein
MCFIVLIVLGLAVYLNRQSNIPVEEPVAQADIKINSPAPYQEAASPLEISGQARGSWFFEAVFPVKIEGLNGAVIARGQAQAKGDWMTSDFVDFSASIDFQVSEKTNAVLVFQNDNPSGLPENAKEYRFPVVLLPSVGDDFIKTGNLIQHNLGEGLWFFSYEEPGSPGLEVSLVVGPESRCGSGTAAEVCDIAKFQAGQRVEISGQKRGEMVLVTSLIFLEQEADKKKEVKLYYYDQSLDKDVSGNILCSSKGLAAVKRMIPATLTPIQDTIKLLIEGNLTDEERKQGITTEFPLAGLSLKGASQNGSRLTLDLIDPNNKTSGGSCRAGILWFQIEATAMQFPGVVSVRPLDLTLFQP